MPLITASWTEPDDDGIQTAEYGGFTLRVYPADTPPPGAAQLSWFGDPRPGFAWEVTDKATDRWDSGWITTRAAARTEALGKAFLRHNPDVPALGNRPANSPPPTAKVTCRAKKTTA